MFSANMTNNTDYKAVDGSFKFFQHNSSKNVYEKLILYKKESEKQIKLNSHRSFINLCLRSEIIPKFVIKQTKAMDNRICTYKRQLQFQITENALSNISKLTKKNEKLLNSLYGTLLDVYTKTGILVNFQKWLNNLKVKLN